MCVRFLRLVGVHSAVVVFVTAKKGYYGLKYRLWVSPFELVKFQVYLYVIVFRFVAMENDAGEFVDLYCPRKW